VAFGTCTVVVAREDWHGYLHSAVPRLVVADDGSALVDWAPAGTVGVYASSRHYPGREHLPRNERKLLTLETCQWLYSSLASETNALNFLDDQKSSSTTLGWSQDGDFLGGYVNFQRPLMRTRMGCRRTDRVNITGTVRRGGRSWISTGNAPAAALGVEARHQAR
jgi:hypothetical protein